MAESPAPKKGAAKDGIPYQNTHTWYFRMKNGKVVSTIAFFDTRKFDEFWNRVSPAR
jgi:ketosteroid isomerase-like protein